MAAHFLPRHKAASSGISVNVIISHYAPSKLMCRLFDRLHLHCCSSPALCAYLTTLSALTLYNIQQRGTVFSDHHRRHHHHHHRQQQQQKGTNLSFQFCSVFMAVSLSISSFVEPRFCCWSQYIHTLTHTACIFPSLEIESTFT